MTSFIICLILFTRVVPRIKSKGLLIDVSYHLSYVFTRTVPRIKSNRLLIDVPYHVSYSFYTRSTVYKKQGAPD
jgi:hypothetical protein